MAEEVSPRSHLRCGGQSRTKGSTSIYGFLFRERGRLLPDGLFTDLFAAIGRRSVPPSVVAVVMVAATAGRLI
jgi:hypothetical protein